MRCSSYCCRLPFQKVGSRAFKTPPAAETDFLAKSHKIHTLFVSVASDHPLHSIGPAVGKILSRCPTFFFAAKLSYDDSVNEGRTLGSRLETVQFRTCLAGRKTPRSQSSSAATGAKHFDQNAAASPAVEGRG